MKFKCFLFRAQLYMLRYGERKGGGREREREKRTRSILANTAVTVAGTRLIGYCSIQVTTHTHTQTHARARKRTHTHSHTHTCKTHTNTPTDRHTHTRRAEHKLHSISELFISQVILPQVTFFEPIYIPWAHNTGTCIQQGDLFYSSGLHRNWC